MENKEVYKKLLNIQQKLKAPKGQFNDFGKYHYRSCEDILEEIKPHLARENAILYFVDKVENVGNRNYIRTDLHFIDINSGEELVNSAYAREEEVKKGMDGSQITGASSSYARKYALNGLFAIDDTKDSDVTNKGDEPKNKVVKEEFPKTLIEEEIVSSNQFGAYKFKSGKYEGKTIAEVYMTDKGYLEFLINSGNKGIVVEYIKEYMKNDLPE